MIKRRRAIVRLEDSDGARVSWTVLEADGTPVNGGRHAALDDAASGLAGLKPVLLVPGPDVLLTSASVPSRSRRQLAQAVPYALEESLVEEVDRLHFGFGTREPSGVVGVAVVARERLRGWLQHCEAAGLTPAFVTSDVLAVPVSAEGWAVLLLDGMALVRTGVQGGFAVEQETLPEMLRAARENGSEGVPSGITLYRDNSSAAAALSAGIGRLGFACTDKVRGNAFEWLCEGFEESRAINLLQDGFARSRPGSNALRPWRLSFALAAIWLALELGLGIFDYHRLAGQRQALEQRTVAIYRQTFPQAQRVVDPRVQMERHLQALRGGSSADAAGFLTLLGGAAEALRAIPGGKLRSLSYHGGRLELDLRLADMQGLDRLKHSLGARGGLSADILSATSDNGKVDARLRVSAGGRP